MAKHNFLKKKKIFRDPRYGRLPVWLKAEIAYISGISKDIFKIPQDKKKSQNWSKNKVLGFFSKNQ